MHPGKCVHVRPEADVTLTQYDCGTPGSNSYALRSQTFSLVHSRGADNAYMIKVRTWVSGKCDLGFWQV